MQGQIFKIHSDFHYVQTDGKIFECKLKDTLKKQQKLPFVGDNVILSEIDKNSRQAFIEKIEERKNFILRPKVANVDLALLVVAFREPEISFEQIDRFLCFFNFHKIETCICFNKKDLLDDSGKKALNVYKNLGFKTIVTCAKSFETEELAEKIENKIVVFSGVSGAGKSSLINALKPELNLRTKKVSSKLERGTHTTRHVEMYKIDKTNSYIIDTPGFANLKFDFLMPEQLQKLFSEFDNLKNECFFKNCSHTFEKACNILQNLDKIELTRYESYKKFLKESQEYKKKVIFEGNKFESKSKLNKNRTFVKISEKQRQPSRKRVNQNRVDFEETEE